MNKEQIRQEALRIVIGAIAQVNIDYSNYDRIDDAFDVINEITKIKNDLEFELQEATHCVSMEALIERAKAEGITLRRVCMGDAHFRKYYESNELIETYWEVIGREGVVLLRANEDDAVEFVQGVIS